MYDAIVVGARCAGSLTAMLLGRLGYRVLLLDRATFPSDAPRCHFIQPPGVARLKLWGLLDPIRASNCPAIPVVRFDVGPFALVSSPPPPHGEGGSYGPRRTVLDFSYLRIPALMRGPFWDVLCSLSTLESFGEAF